MKMEGKAIQKVRKGIIAEAAIFTALEEFCRNEFGQDTEDKIRKKAEYTIKELSNTLRNLKSNKTGEAAVSHLPPGWITLMKKALDLNTFQVEIDENNHIGKVVMHGTKMKIDPTPLKGFTAYELKRFTDLQKASIVVDAIIFLHNIAGVQIPTDDRNYEDIIVDIIRFLDQKPILLQDIEQIQLNLENIPNLITRIICLGCDAFEDGMFWMIVRRLYATLALDKKILNAAQIVAFVGTLVLTDEFETIAILLANLVKAQDFVKKLNNLVTIDNAR